MQQIGAVTQQLKPDRGSLAADLIAGLTFAIVNVPQAMAQALLAAVNPVNGIYTLMVAVPVGAIFTSSVFMNVSPTSALAVAAGAGLADTPQAQRLEALAVMVMLMGVFQLLAGIFRLGFLLRFVSNAVMVGFLNGVAVLIILGQLGDLTGFESQFSNRVAQTIELSLNLRMVSTPTTLIGLLTLGGIVLLLRTSLRKFAFIIAIAGATLLLAVLKLPALPTAAAFASVVTVGTIAQIPSELPHLALPHLDLIFAMILPAFSVAIIGLIQGAGVSQGMPNPDGKYPNVSRDFFGQGMANIAGSLVAGIPAGGSVSGTAVLVGAGARTRWANISAGIFVGAIVLLLAPLVELVPMPALAALLVMAGFQGLRIPQAVMIWKTGRIPTLVMLTTLAATLFIPLQYAVLLGVVLSSLLYVIRQSNKIVITEWVLQPQGFPVEQPAPKQLASNHITVLNIYGSLFFAAAKNLEEMLPVTDGVKRAIVMLGLRGKSEIGSTFMTVLQRYAKDLHAHDSRLMLVGVDPAVREQLANTGMLAIIGEENVFLATPQIGEAFNQAVAAAKAWLDQSIVQEAAKAA